MSKNRKSQKRRRSLMRENLYLVSKKGEPYAVYQSKRDADDAGGKVTTISADKIDPDVTSAIEDDHGDQIDAELRVDSNGKVVGLYGRKLSPKKGFKDSKIGIEVDYNRSTMDFRESRRRQGKSLLSERTKIRWATLAAINEGGMGDAYDAEEREEDLDMDMGDEPEMDMDLDDEPDMDMDLDDEPEMDMGDEGDDEVILSDEEVEAALPLLQKLVAAAEGMAGEGEEDLGDELMEPMGDEDEGPEMDEMPDLEDEEGEEEDEELAENLSRLERLNVQVVDQNKIVKEVMKRVTKRLLKRL